jgi:glyoxylase-like metal-dependent hydrolase (beta-lactamase superfamily II)
MSAALELIFPHPAPPQPGEIAEVAPGILWLRLALPFALDHVNIYLIEDGAGWAVLDTGVADLRTRTAWQQVIAGRTLSRLIVTHYHPDHVGLAGWMTEALGLELLMSRTEYLFAQHLRHNPEAFGAAPQRDFYRRRGVDEVGIDALLGRGHDYLKLTTGLPPSFTRLAAGERLALGGRTLDVLTGGGHAPEQVMLLDRGAGVFLAADQVLARISPNVGVWPVEPEADPLGAYLESLRALREEVPDEVLVLPAHNLPFYGLHQRIAALQAHHEQRCDALIEACVRPLSTAELVPVLFPRALDPHQLGFAFGETQAHVNYLLARGALAAEPGDDGVERMRRR